MFYEFYLFWCIKKVANPKLGNFAIKYGRWIW